MLDITFFGMQAVAKHLTGAALGAHIRLEFETDRVSLEIPHQDMTEKGWSIIPLTPPVVRLYS